MKLIFIHNNIVLNFNINTKLNAYVFTLIIRGMILGRRNVNIDNTNKKYDFINISHFMFVKIINSNIILNVNKYISKYINNFNVIYIFRNTMYLRVII